MRFRLKYSRLGSKLLSNPSSVSSCILRKGAGHEMCPAQWFSIVFKTDLIAADLNRLQHRDVDWLIK